MLRVALPFRRESKHPRSTVLAPARSYHFDARCGRIRVGSETDTLLCSPFLLPAIVPV